MYSSSFVSTIHNYTIFTTICQLDFFIYLVQSLEHGQTQGLPLQICNYIFVKVLGLNCDIFCNSLYFFASSSDICSGIIICTSHIRFPRLPFPSLKPLFSTIISLPEVVPLPSSISSISSIPWTFILPPRAASQGVIKAFVCKSYPFKVNLSFSNTFTFMNKSPGFSSFAPFFPCPIKRILSLLFLDFRLQFLMKFSLFFRRRLLLE